LIEGEKGEKLTGVGFLYCRLGRDKGDRGNQEDKGDKGDKEEKIDIIFLPSLSFLLKLYHGGFKQFDI